MEKKKLAIIIASILCIILIFILAFIIINKNLIQDNKTDETPQTPTEPIYNEPVVGTRPAQIDKTRMNFNEICPSYKNGCDKRIGSLSIGSKIYTMFIHYEYNKDNDEMDEEKESCLEFSGKKITLNDKGAHFLYFIKINDNLLGIATLSSGSGWYSLYIYDEDLNEVKRITDAGNYNDNNEAFDISSNKITYTRHSFATAEDADEKDLDDSGLAKYKEVVTITIDDKTFKTQMKREPIKN